MGQWLKRSRDRFNNKRRFQRGPSSVISKSLGDLPMNGSGEGMFFSRLNEFCGHSDIGDMMMYEMAESVTIIKNLSPTYF